MPGRRLTRKDLSGSLVAGPLACFVVDAIIAEPGVRSLEECIRDLLESGEEVQGESDDRQIVKNGMVVGFIEIRRIT